MLTSLARTRLSWRRLPSCPIAPLPQLQQGRLPPQHIPTPAYPHHDHHYYYYYNHPPWRRHQSTKSPPSTSRSGPSWKCVYARTVILPSPLTPASSVRK